MGQFYVELAELEVHVFVIALMADVEVPESSLGWSEVWRWCFVSCVGFTFRWRILEAESCRGG
jgi:hypothetical protein